MKCQTGMLMAMLVLAETALAQAPDLSIIRRTSPVSPLDQQNVQKWIDEHLDQLFASQNLDADIPKFTTQMLEHVRAADATPAFKEAMAQSLTAGFLKRYAGNPPPRAVSTVLVVLDEYKEIAALDAFKSALADTTNGVRYIAAKGLLGLRSKLTAQQWTALLPDIKKAAIAESHPATLQAIYRLLSVDPKADAPAQEVLPVFLEILDTRLKRCEQNRELPNPGEREAAFWLKDRAQAAPSSPRNNDIVLILARILAGAVLAHADPQSASPQKELLATLIQACEQQLKDVAKVGNRVQPDVSKAITDGGAGAAQKAVEELDKWIGTDTAEGFLNQAPFNFPRGLGIKRPAPATVPAPATQVGDN